MSEESHRRSGAESLDREFAISSRESERLGGSEDFENLEAERFCGIGGGDFVSLFSVCLAISEGFGAMIEG